MHLLETSYQRAWLDANYPGGIVRYLDAIGLLSPRLTLAHCAWARPDELALIAERGATISVNTSSNLHLRSGIAPLAENASSAAAGWRSASMARRSTKTTMRCAKCGSPTCCTAAPASATDVDRPAMLRMAFQTGRLSVTNKDDGGALAAGEPADILVLDWDAVDAERLRADLDPFRSPVRAHHHAPHPRADRGGRDDRA